MTYTTVAQTSESAPVQFSRANGVIPLPATVGAGQNATVQASFGGTYSGGSYGFRATIQAPEGSLIDPSKQYRVTIEEVTA